MDNILPLPPESFTPLYPQLPMLSTINWQDIVSLIMIAVYVWIFACDGWFVILKLFFTYGWSVILTAAIMNIVLVYVVGKSHKKDVTE